MHGITDIDLRQTGCYQDVFAEGQLEGRQEGCLEGLQTEASRLLRRWLPSRFGSLPEWAETQLDQAMLDTLECWADHVGDAGSLATVRDW